jgi:hypothetical protein
MKQHKLTALDHKIDRAFLKRDGIQIGYTRTQRDEFKARAIELGVHKLTTTQLARAIPGQGPNKCTLEELAVEVQSKS